MTHFFDPKPNVSSFSKLLPYRVFDAEREVFINTKSVMKLFEFPMLSGANEKLIEDLVNLMNKHIESEVYVRFFRVTHHKLKARLDRIFEEYGKNGKNGKNGHSGEIYARLAEKQRAYMDYAVQNGFPNTQNRILPLLDSRVFLEISVASSSYNQDKKIEALQTLGNKLEIELSSMNIPLVAIKDKEFLSLMRLILRFSKNEMDFDYGYDSHEYLSDQMIELDASFSVFEDHIEQNIEDQEEVKVSTYVVKKFPEKFALFNTGAYLAQLTSNASTTTPHVFSVAFSMIPREKSLGEARSKFFSLSKSANSPMVRLFPKLKDQFNEWTHIREGLEREEIQLVNAHISITLFSDEKTHALQKSHFERCMSGCGFEVTVPHGIQLPLFLGLLPGFLAEGYFEEFTKLRLFKKMTSWNLVNILPLVGDWKGSYTGVIFPGFHNQLSSIDYFSDQVPTDNNNVAVAAGSGAGKSVLVQTLLLHVLATGGVAYIIDKGDSYKKLCETLKGAYISAGNLQLNPFTHLHHVKNQDDLKDYFAQIRDLLACLVSPQKPLDSVSNSFLLEATHKAYTVNREQTNIDSVCLELAILNQNLTETHGERDTRISDLMTLLKPYKLDGLYGKYFNLPSTIDPTAKLVVLELGGIEGNSDLLQPVLFSLINTISQRMYLSDRSLRKMCVIDEAWSLLSGDNPVAASFIEKGFRTSRKHGGSFVTITQSIEDYYQDACAKACWTNSDIKIIMRQNDEALKAFMARNTSHFSDYELRILRQFKPALEVGFSSMMFKAGSLTSFHRLFNEPYLKILTTTKASEFQMVFDLQKQGLDLWDAIERTAEHFYGDEIEKIYGGKQK